MLFAVFLVVLCIYENKTKRSGFEVTEKTVEILRKFFKKEKVLKKY